MLPGVNKLKVFSSREEFEFDFELYEVLESKLEKYTDYGIDQK